MAIRLPDGASFNGGILEVDPATGDRTLLVGQAYVDDGTTSNVIEVLPANADSVFLDGVYAIQDGGSNDLIFTTRWGPLAVYRYDLDTGELFVLSDLEAQLDSDFAAYFEPTGLVILKASECPADFNGDGVVNVPDLIFLLGEWGDNPGSPADFDGDGLVRVPDLLIVLGAWGPCN